MTRFLVLALLVFGGCKKDGAGGADGKNGGGDDDSFKNRDGISVVECSDRFGECGGDPTGSWDLYAVCDPGSEILDAVCKKAKVEVTRDRSRGTLDMYDDGTWERELVIDLDYDIHIPASCVGTFMTCSILEGLSGTLVKQCKEKKNGDCDCKGTFKPPKVTKNGEWEKKGAGYVTEDGRTDICIEGGLMDAIDSDGVRVLWQ